MRYLKTFNESAIDGKIEDFNGIRNTILNSRFTHKYDCVTLKSLYKAIIIKTVDPINTKNLQTISNMHHASSVGSKWDSNWIAIDLQSIIASYSLKILPDIKSVEGWCKSKYIDQNDTFENYPIIGYNDVNHAEIENIFLEYGISVDDIWGIPVDL